MAGEWIKVEASTADKPEVLRIARILAIPHDAVFGKLVRLWAWIDTNSVDGVVDGVVDADIDRICRCDGFTAACVTVGWLEYDASMERVSLPNFERHNGETAKQRAMKNRRQAKWRAGVDDPVDAAASTEASTREEKRREEVKQEPKKKQPRVSAQPAPDDVDPQTWADWLALRKAKRAPVSETVIREARKEAAKAGMAFGQFLAVWCRRGSQGLEADWLKPNERAGPIAQQSKTLTAIQTLQGMKHGHLDSQRDSGRPEPPALLGHGSDSGG